MKHIYLLGRHIIAFPDDIEVVGSEAVTFPATAQDCIPVLQRLGQAARVAGAEWIVFVGMPPQVAAALSPFPRDAAGELLLWREPNRERLGGLRLGVVVSVPGPRPTAQETVVIVPAGYGEDVAAAMRRLNPNAKIRVEAVKPIGVGEDGVEHVVAITDTPMRFEFSHIEEM